MTPGRATRLDSRDAAAPAERRVLLWMCVLVAVNQLGFGSVVPVLPLYAQSFGVSASAVGLTIAVYGLARFLVAAPAGQISDRLGRRPTLALGGLVTALGNLWCAAASGYPEFVLARFVAGAGAGLILTTGQIVLADITTPARRGRTMAIYQGVFIFSVGVGPFPGGLLAEHFGLAAPFLAYGIAGTLSGIVAWVAVGETRELGRARAAGARVTLAVQLRMLARRAGFLLVCLLGFMSAVARTGGLFNVVPLIGSLRLGLGAAQIGAGFAAGSLFGLIAAYPAGMLVDRFGRKSVIVPATFMAAASMLLFCVAPSYPWFFAACLVWGVASAVGSAAPAAYAADSAPPGMNAVTVSTYRMISDSGYVIGPVMLGLLADAAGAEAALIAAAALLATVAALFWRRAPETFRAHPGREQSKEGRS